MIYMAASSFVFAISIFIMAPIAIGSNFLFLDVSRGGPVTMDTLVEAFKSYIRYLLAILLVYIYTMLWSLLLIVPGIIKSISYSMTYYIMRDNPEIGAEQAVRQSMAMMKGHKMDYFLLSLSFIGWVILACIPLCLGFLWIGPYMETTYGAFYEELKKDYEVRIAFASVASGTTAE